MKLRLRVLLAELEVSQKDLAKAMGVRFEAVNRWTNNHQVPNLKKLGEVLDTLERMTKKKLNITDLLERE